MTAPHKTQKTQTAQTNQTAETPEQPPKPAWWHNFGAQILIGLVIGIIFGLFARHYSAGTDALAQIAQASGTLLGGLGSAYVQLLRIMVVPLVFTAVVTSVAQLRQVTNAAKLAVSTLIWFAITAFFSVLAGIGVALLINPGIGAHLDLAATKEPSTSGSWLAFFQSVLPTNIFGIGATLNTDHVAINFNVLQILVISLAIGIAAVKAGKDAEPFLKVAESLLKIVQVILWWIIRLAPIGTAALIGHAVAHYGWNAIGSLGTFTIAIYLGLAVVLLIIYPVVLAYHRLPILEFYRRVWPVTSLGFLTRSSLGVMPVTQRIAEEKLGVPREYASFAIPLGSTTKMDGCASIYPAIAAVFVAQFFGIALSPVDYLLIIAVSVLGSAATAGTTGAIVMLTLTLSTLGLPLAGAGLLLAIDPILDMGRTAVNVTGQALVSVVVARRAGILDEASWDH
ncbi:dicarboxylate/amino acid:cation symporter [Corynebacterium spheniscorum]|uniref:Na+/H+-dicarboxylate symporter n=1 Tax=Corynebacterium spheniscorum TaxID=185761 RepID=A0A1I2V197_9CORY|nr:dicarboxylate/amino acid:cation symporter [Corynebacterium spheniscorum]KAA8719776.1 dicarboxylate/amino acid:cation symporter [Corynebacterium spheniscorum]SFG83104.1 Na+/H+-dicarboxylate symporter [Corynebacterium spheniscorum]